MLNAEKYKNELLKVINENEQDFIAFDERDNSIKNCTTMVCKDCKFTRTKAKALCTQTKLKWLLSEYKEPIKLSRFEYDILKYLSDNTRHMYITRDGNGNIFLYDVEPEKSKSAPWWTGRGMCHMGMFNKLFQFVQWEDSTPTSIKEVLDNCVVKEIKEEQ
jgi:hypothetical protein